MSAPAGLTKHAHAFSFTQVTENKSVGMALFVFYAALSGRGGGFSTLLPGRCPGLCYIGLTGRKGKADISDRSDPPSLKLRRAGRTDKTNTTYGTDGGLKGWYFGGGWCTIAQGQF